MFFIGILALTTFAIAGAAAYFSVIGLASIFSGAFWAVVIMGSALEAGKLVSASFLYRYWEKITFLMKTYLVVAVLSLMLLTSTGIFGFLSAAYQQDTLPLKEIEQKIVLLQDEKSSLELRQRQIDEQIEAVPPTYVSKRMELMEKFAPERDRIGKRLNDVTAEIQQLSTTKINQQAHVGPIIYIAKVFDKEVDDATKYMIFIIIFVFDPLAVILTISTNIAVANRKGGKEALVGKKPSSNDDDGLDDDSNDSVNQNIEDDNDTTEEPNPKIQTVDDLVNENEPVSDSKYDDLAERIDEMQGYFQKLPEILAQVSKNNAVRTVDPYLQKKNELKRSIRESSED